MENLVYTYKSKILQIAKYIVFLLLISSSFIKLTVTTAIQQIVFSHNEELLMIVHETKIKKIMVNIKFKDIEALNLFENKKNHFDIQVDLKDGKKFLLFNFGEYVPKKKQSVEREKDRIEKYIALKVGSGISFFGE